MGDAPDQVRGSISCATGVAEANLASVVSTETSSCCQRDVERVDQPEVLPHLPSLEQKWGKGVPLGRDTLEPSHPIGPLPGGELPGANQPSQRREHLGVEVSGHVDLRAPETLPYRAGRWGADQQIHHRRCVDDDPFSQRLPARRGRRRRQPPRPRG